MASVTVEGLEKSYPKRSKYCDVTGVSFTVQDGEFFCVVGPSNSGKTSTLRLIAGLDAADSGTIRIGERDVTEVTPHERGASMLFQNLALYPNKTGYENIVHPLRIGGIPEAEREERVQSLAETLGITHLLDRQPETFSGGEKQRVGIARALIKDATVNLLDEPLGGLDAKLKAQMRVELNRLQNDLGETFILATHDQEEALSVADRIAVCNGGRVHQIGTPEELYDEPADQFVAGFIGEPAMNFLRGRVTDGHLRLNDIDIALDRPTDDGEYTVGIRPHDLTIQQSDGRNGVTANVDVSEPLGQESIVDLETTGLSLRAVSDQEFAKELEHGDRVSFEITASDIYLFDAETGATVSSPTRS